jgi:hypothetical protein
MIMSKRPSLSVGTKGSTGVFGVFGVLGTAAAFGVSEAFGGMIVVVWCLVVDLDRRGILVKVAW